MLKSSLIFKRNGAHLVENKTFEKNEDCLFLRFECFEHVKTFLIVSSFEHINFTINENIPKTFITIQTIMLPL